METLFLSREGNQQILPKFALSLVANRETAQMATRLLRQGAPDAPGRSGSGKGGAYAALRHFFPERETSEVSLSIGRLRALLLLNAEIAGFPFGKEPIGVVAPETVLIGKRASATARPSQRRLRRLGPALNRLAVRASTGSSIVSQARQAAAWSASGRAAAR